MDQHLPQLRFPQFQILRSRFAVANMLKLLILESIGWMLGGVHISLNTPGSGRKGREGHFTKVETPIHDNDLILTLIIAPQSE